MGIGHEGQKIYLKWWKWVDAIALFQLHDEDSWLFSSPCNATGLVLQFVSKKATKSHNRKYKRETKFDIFTKLSEPSFQAFRLYNTILSDVRKFKRCLCNTSTKYK